MNKFFKIAAGFAIVLASVFLFLLWDAKGYWPISKTCGRMEAHIDLARGRYRQLGAGLHPFGMEIYARLLRQKYGVDYKSLGGCIVSNATIDYMEAYDSVSEPAINRKFGHDIFKEVASESLSFRRPSP